MWISAEKLPTPTSAARHVLRARREVLASSAPLRQVSISDPLPAFLNYVDGSASDGGSYDSASRSLTWTYATLTAASPTFLFQLFQPMNDVTAACLWCGALVAACAVVWNRSVPRVS